MQELTELPTLARVGFPSHLAGYSQEAEALEKVPTPQFQKVLSRYWGSCLGTSGERSGNSSVETWQNAEFSRISNKNSCLKTDDKGLGI